MTIDLSKVVRLSFEKERIIQQTIPSLLHNGQHIKRLLKALLLRIDALIKENHGKIDEEIASEIIIASMLYISEEAGFDTTEEHLNTIVGNFLSGALLGFNIPEGYE
jgi:hypothetical protein